MNNPNWNKAADRNAVRSQAGQAFESNAAATSVTED